MASLVACLSTGKGTWGHVARLISDQEWESMFLITNDFGKENFKVEGKELTFIIMESKGGLIEMRNNLIEKLKDKLQGDVAVNLVSGTGKEHTAILGALLKLGIGIRLVAVTKEGIEEI